MTNSYRKSLPVFLDLIRPEWLAAAGILLANLVAAFLEGSTLALLALGLRKLGSAEQGSFLFFVFAAVAAQLLKSAFQYAAMVAASSLEVRVHQRTYGQVFEKILSLPFEQVSRYKLGHLTDYLAQSNQMSDLFLQLNLLIRNILMVAAYGLLLCWLSWPMTLLALAGYAAVSGLLRKVVQAVGRHAARFTAAQTQLSEQTAEQLQALRVLHTFGRQAEAAEQVHQLLRQGSASRLKSNAWGAVIEPAMEMLTVLGAAAFLGIGSWLLGHAGADQLPRLLALLLAFYRLTPRLGAIHASLTILAARLPNLERLEQILSQPTPPKETAATIGFHGIGSGIQFEQVTHRYSASAVAAVQDLSFSIAQGSLTALVGPSGAGKSTVADLLLKLYEPTQGKILVHGADLQQLPTNAWRQRLGVVSQDLFLFHDTLANNMAYGKPEATRQQIIAAAQAAHAHGFISQLSQGYDTVIGDRGLRLSGGQRQRIALARALIRCPDLLILDEATSALDSESERLIQQALQEQRGQRTLLVIAHRLSTISRADQIFVLHEGRLLEQGSHAELLEQGGLYHRLWRLQSDEIPETAQSRP